MTVRDFARWTAAGSLAVVLCATSSLQAQVDTTRRARPDTTRARSTQRIPIRKESRGEVALPTRTRTDSAAYADSVARASQARNDSIMRADRARNDSIAAAERARTEATVTTRNDSLANAARTDSIARAEQARTDSISRAEQARADSIARVNPVAGAAVVTEQNMQPTYRKRPGSFFIGLAAGRSAPQGEVEDLGYGSGLNVTVPFGWHNPSKMFGIRFTVAYDQFDGNSFTTGGPVPVVLSNTDPKVYSADVNLNMRFPFNEQRTSSVYLFGGGGLYMFKNFGTASALGAYLGNDVLDPNDEANESTINKWGVNGGAGIEFGIGTSALFLESRIVNVFTGREDNPNFDSIFGSRGTSVRWVPLVLGFTIR